MFGLGMPELIVILVVIMLIFGAPRLPHMAESLGKAIKNFRRAASDSDRAIEEDKTTKDKDIVSCDNKK